MINHNTYLGKKGYTIYKSSLSIKEQNYLRNELMVKPFLPNSPKILESYPIFRESENKFYVPRYFGIKNYGEPNEYKINKGKTIDIEFKGELRSQQIIIINKFKNYIDNNEKSGLLDLYTGMGKTVMALKIISIIKLKTLIIVHKGFLLDQWKERINQFLPSAKVGKIQGQIIDIEDKDIVIGMLQSLSMKEYPENMFNEFGFTIIDEVHHISAEIFCRALQNIVTLYNLGLSATMNRKDGLSKVFKMFLGDVIHKEKNNNDYKVLVKSILFKTPDLEFNEIEYDFRGNIKFTTMINKLCNFNKRSDLIVELILDELKNNPKQHIMILSLYKSLLVYIFKALNYRNFHNVGYYIGGMKPQELKISESKQIILATYSMASEGLDIKSLSCLVMATPKKDIEQSVGRIMRQKHDDALIIDIIDYHDIFQKQWQIRKKFYLKHEYKILYSENNNINSWKEIENKSNEKKKTNNYEEKNCYEKKNSYENKCLINLIIHLNK